MKMMSSYKVQIYCRDIFWFCATEIFSIEAIKVARLQHAVFEVFIKECKLLSYPLVLLLLERLTADSTSVGRGASRTILRRSVRVTQLIRRAWV